MFRYPSRSVNTTRGTTLATVERTELIRQYWQTDLWNELFETLLNSAAAGKQLPITSDIAVIRGKFEDWLETNCQRGGKNLRGMLKKITTALAS